MVKKSLLILFLMSLVWACATFQPQPPSFYIEDLPQSITTQMSLEQRIAADEAWKDLKKGDSSRAEKSLLRLGSGQPGLPPRIGLHSLPGAGPGGGGVEL